MHFQRETRSEKNRFKSSLILALSFGYFLFRLYKLQGVLIQMAFICCFYLRIGRLNNSGLLAIQVSTRDRRNKEILSGCHFPYLETRGIRFIDLRKVLIKKTTNTRLKLSAFQHSPLLWVFVVHYTAGLCSSVASQGSTTIHIISNQCCLLSSTRVDPLATVGLLTLKVNHILKCFAGLGPPYLGRISFSSMNLPSLLPKGQRKSLFYFLLNLVDLLKHIIFIFSIYTIGIEHQLGSVTGDSRKQTQGSVKAKG